MRENCTSGSARGAPGNRRSYRGGDGETTQPDTDIMRVARQASASKRVGYG